MRLQLEGAGLTGSQGRAAADPGEDGQDGRTGWLADAVRMGPGENQLR